MNQRGDIINDFEYLYMIRQGSEDAMDTLSENYDKLLWKTCHVNFRIQEPFGIQVNDLYQEAKLGLLEALFSYQESRGVGLAHYIKICVTSYVQSELRRCRGQSYCLLNPYYSLEFEFSDDGSIMMMDLLEDKSTEYAPAYQAQMEESKVILKNIISELSQLEQDIYSLWIDGYSYKEIASVCDTTVKQVDNKIQKIKRLVYGKQ